MVTNNSVISYLEIKIMRVFIHNYLYQNDWIMGIISDDIKREANRLGIECRSGMADDYQGEEICYHLDYHLAQPIKSAKHNSVFYTHLNDAIQENNLISIKGKFDSYICMSPEDAQYLIDLGFDKSKVFGKILPVRNTYIRPVSIGIFSACYIDGRKNEAWLLEFCRNRPASQFINFVFVGPGWGKVCSELESISCSFEWHNVSRKMPFEYEFQQHKLANLNYYIYMGMDGGAMGTYDAYAHDVPLCVTYDGFHKEIPDIDYKFDNKETFFTCLEEIVSKHERRLSFFKDNSPKNYVSWLIKVWNGEQITVIKAKDTECISYNSVLEKKRNQYYSINFLRLLRGFKIWNRRRSFGKINGSK